MSYSEVKKVDFFFFPGGTSSCQKILVSVSLSKATRCGDRSLLLPMTRKKMDRYGDKVNSESDTCHCRCVESEIDMHVK